MPQEHQVYRVKALYLTFYEYKHFRGLTQQSGGQKYLLHAHNREKFFPKQLLPTVAGLYITAAWKQLLQR